MEIYANYSYYINEYKGQLDKPLFDKYATNASLEISNLTHHKALPDIKEVKNCMCKLVDVMNANEQCKTSISSEKVGNHTVTFVTKSTEDKDKEYYYIINRYLGSLGLLGGAIPVVY